MGSRICVAQKYVYESEFSRKVHFPALTKIYLCSIFAFSAFSVGAPFFNLRLWGGVEPSPQKREVRTLQRTLRKAPASFLPREALEDLHCALFRGEPFSVS